MTQGSAGKGKETSTCYFLGGNPPAIVPKVRAQNSLPTSLEVPGLGVTTGSCEAPLCLWEGVLLFLKMPFCKMLST